jgi:hypothetical protein
MTDEAFKENEPVGFATAEGTISFVLLTAACISIVSNKLPSVFV